MKIPFVFLALDALMVLGYGVVLVANLFRRVFSRRTKM